MPSVHLRLLSRGSLPIDRGVSIGRYLALAKRSMSNLHDPSSFTLSNRLFNTLASKHDLITFLSANTHHYLLSFDREPCVLYFYCSCLCKTLRTRKVIAPFIVVQEGDVGWFAPRTQQRINGKPEQATQPLNFWANHRVPCTC